MMMLHKAKQEIDPGWTSSSRGERAWKEATDRVESRNADARKAGRAEREAYERKRDAARRAAAAERHAKLVKRHSR
jgi:hypothetical protein